MDPWICHALAAVLWLISTAAVAATWRRTKETTLLPALLWAVAACLVMTLINAALAYHPAAAWAQHAIYCGGVLTFCPLMAVLGARRPQHRAWQLIVLSLLVTATLPAVVAWLYSSAPLEMHLAWRWLLLLPLAAISFGNNVPTRFWPSGLSIFAAQVLLLQRQLPLIGEFAEFLAPGPERMLAAAVLALLAAGLWSWDVPRRTPRDNSFDRLWLDFRDTFGAVWALRVAERLNAAADMYQWPLWVSWRGLRLHDDPGDTRLSPEVQAALYQATRNLLRRFVDEPWIARRWDGA